MLQSLGVRSTFFRVSRNQLFVLLVLWGALLAQPLAAAPLLVGETSNGRELLQQKWFEDVPVDAEFSGFEDGAGMGMEDMPEQPIKRTTVRRVSQAANVRSSRSNLFNEPDGVPQNSSLQNLLRTYLNAQAGIEGMAQDSSGFFITNSGNMNRAAAGSDVVGKEVVDDVLARTFGFVVQPGINDRGLMTFSILGLGEFALIGGNAGVTLSLGDFFSFSVFGSGPDVILPGALMGGANSMMEATGAVSGGSQSGLSDYSSANGGLWKTAAIVEGPEGTVFAGSNRNGGPGEDAAGKPRLSRFIVLLYDVLTYPGTILTLLILLLLQLIKVGKRLKERRARYIRMRNQLASRRKLQF